MASVLLLAIVIGIAMLLLGSVAFELLSPINDVILSPQEKKCQQKS